MREPVVVGAFPEPFLHGYGGPPRPAVVRYEPGLAKGARAIGRLAERDLRPAHFGPGPEGRECVLHSKRHAAVLGFAPRRGRRRRARRCEFVFAGDAAALARNPRRFRFRYEVP